MTASLADAEEIRVDVAIVGISLDLGGILTLKEEQRTPLTAFLCGKYAFVFLPVGFGKTLVKRHIAAQ